MDFCGGFNDLDLLTYSGNEFCGFIIYIIGELVGIYRLSLLFGANFSINVLIKSLKSMSSFISL